MDNTASSADQVEMDAWVNAAVLDFLVKTHCNVKGATTPLTAGQGDYDLDSDILAINDVYVTGVGDSSSRMLERSGVDQILSLRTRESADSVARNYAVNGTHLLMVYPTPSAADVMTVYYIPRPTAMTDGTHDPSNALYGGIPTEYHKALEYYVLWQAAEHEDHQPSRSGLTFRNLYIEEVKQASRSMRGKGGRRLSPARLRPTRSSLPADPART